VNIGERVPELRQHVESTWAISKTLVDIGFVRQGRDLLDVGHNPISLAPLLIQYAMDAVLM
jgi:hypothetical protein